MPRYELIFVVRHLSEDLAEALYDTDLDCFVATDFDERHTITVSAPGVDAVTAAKAMLTELHSLGVEVQFVQHDLVNRAEIADRLDVSRSLVSQWVSGAKGRAPFPAGFSDAAGGVWIWGDVARWRRSNALPAGDDVEHPTRAELDHINDFIRSGCLSSDQRHFRAPQKIFLMHDRGMTAAWGLLGEGNPVALRNERLPLEH